MQEFENKEEKLIDIKGTFEETISSIFILIPLPIRKGTSAMLPCMKEVKFSTNPTNSISGQAVRNSAE